MPDTSTPSIPLAVLIAASLLSVGCVSTLQESLPGEGLESQSVSSVAVQLAATNASSDLAHLGVTVSDVFVHNASQRPPEGYYELNVTSPHADVVDEGEPAQVDLAEGPVPAASYDQVVLRVSNVDASQHQATNASEDTQDGSGDSDSHDHGFEPGEESPGDTKTRSFDVPVNLTFEVQPGASTELSLVLDASASTENGFEPVLDRVDIAHEGVTSDQVEDPDVGFRQAQEGAPTDTQPPVARITAYAPGGEKAYQPDFTVEDGTFVNSRASAYGLGKTLRFSASESNAVEDGAVIESYAWSFGDGSNATGTTVSHAYDEQGVYEVTLTVEDSRGVRDSHTLRVVVLQKTWTTVHANTSFEDGKAGWAAGGGGDTTWALDGAGRASETAWHVGHHLVHTQGLPGEASLPGYTAGASAALKSKPVEIPANWSSAGFRLSIAGSSEAGFDILDVFYSYGDTSQAVGSFSGQQGWRVYEQESGLVDAVGKTVTFTFTFTSDGLVEQGAGWYVDDFAIGGVDLPVHNAHLLEDGAGGHGHDHSH